MACELGAQEFEKKVKIFCKLAKGRAVLGMRGTKPDGARWMERFVQGYILATCFLLLTTYYFLLATCYLVHAPHDLLLTTYH